MTVESKIDLNRLNTDVAIHASDLSGAMMVQASLAAHYGRLAADAGKQAGMLKIRRDVVESKVADELRQNYTASGEKYSEKRLESEVAMDARVVQAKSDYIKAVYEEEFARNAFEAIRQRRDMLIQLGAADREERKGELWMQAKQQNEETVAHATESLRKRLASS